MHTPTLAQIEAILASRELTKFIGAAEGQWFEAKGPTPWNLATHAGRLELAKDVSAFANADGGYIVIGLLTEKLPDKPADQVTTLDMLRADEIGTEKIAGIVRSYVFPPIDGIDVTWLASQEDSGKGIVVIRIPPQADEKKYFVIVKTSLEGEQLKEIVVGIAIRSGASSVPLTAQQVYEAIRQGRDPLLQRSMRIEEKLDALLARPSSAVEQRGSAEEKVSTRIRDILDQNGK